MACFKRGQDKKQELSVKQSSSDGVAAGKTVTRPIHERAVNERAMPMNKKLHPLVQQHAAGNSNDQSYKRRPPSFPRKKKGHREHNNSDPLSGTKLGERAQHTHEHGREMLMKP